MMRSQLKGPNEVALATAFARGFIDNLVYCSGKVLPWTTSRWKFVTS